MTSYDVLCVCLWSRFGHFGDFAAPHRKCRSWQKSDRNISLHTRTSVFARATMPCKAFETHFWGVTYLAWSREQKVFWDWRSILRAKKWGHEHFHLDVSCGHRNIYAHLADCMSFHFRARRKQRSLPQGLRQARPAIRLRPQFVCWFESTAPVLIWNTARLILVTLALGLEICLSVRNSRR